MTMSYECDVVDLMRMSLSAFWPRPCACKAVDSDVCQRFRSSHMLETSEALVYAATMGPLRSIRSLETRIDRVGGWAVASWALDGRVRDPGRVPESSDDFIGRFVSFGSGFGQHHGGGRGEILL
jgi:hypothetical protein